MIWTKGDIVIIFDRFCVCDMIPDYYGWFNFTQHFSLSFQKPVKSWWFGISPGRCQTNTFYDIWRTSFVGRSISFKHCFVTHVSFKRLITVLWFWIIVLSLIAILGYFTISCSALVIDIIFKRHWNGSTAGVWEEWPCFCFQLLNSAENNFILEFITTWTQSREQTFVSAVNSHLLLLNYSPN